MSTHLPSANGTLPTTSRGFTLIETLIAIALMMFAMAGPFVAAEKAYVAAIDSEHRLTATYLAQEGIEYARRMRDNTYLEDYHANRVLSGVDLSHTAFDHDFVMGENGGTTFPNNTTSIYGCEGNPDTDPPGPGGDGSVACALDANLPVGVGTGRALQVCASPTTCPVLLYDSGTYGLVTGTPSIFRRSLRFYNFSSEVEVKSIVTWSTRGVTHTIEFADYLSPWE